MDSKENKEIKEYEYIKNINEDILVESLEIKNPIPNNMKFELLNEDTKNNSKESKEEKKNEENFEINQHFEELGI